MVNLITNKTGRLAALSFFLFVASNLYGQQDAGLVEYAVTRTSQQLEMVVNTSRILTLDKEIPRAMVNNPDIVRVVPLSPSKVQLSAVKAGVTQVNLWDEDGTLYTVNLIIVGDAQELNMLLKTEFPQASLRVRPLSTSVVLSGRVDRSEDVSRIVRMAEDYYPKVINNITVGGVQQVLLNVSVMEVSRTKLRAVGFDWVNIGSSDWVVQSVSGTLGAFSPTAVAQGPGNATITFGIVGPNNQFFGFLEALRDNNLAKILAEPKLTTVSGRPASFNSGGEFPILVPQSLGTLSVEYKQFGTRVDFIPIVLGDGNIRLEVRPQVSELDYANGVTFSGTVVPALRTRWVDTAVEMQAGQTLALAGLLQTRIEAQNRGIPWLADLPWAGAAFRRVQETQNEVELVVLVRPELVEALDPHEVPECLPGQQSTSPSDVELYFRGYLEVPNCCSDGSCANCQSKSFESTYGEVALPPEQQVLPAEALPATGDGAAVVPGGTGTLGGSSYRPAGYSNPSISGRQINRGSYEASDRRSTEDPGLFGRVGYDVLDYKK